MRHIIVAVVLTCFVQAAGAQGKGGLGSVGSGTIAPDDRGIVDKSDVPEVQTVLDAYAEAIGGEAAVRGLKGLTRTYSWKMEEESGTLLSRAGKNGAFRVDMTMDGSTWHESQNSDGTKTWLKDAEGTCFPAADAIAILLRMEHDPAALLDISDLIRAMTVSGEVIVAGEPNWRVIMVPKIGKPWYLFFDINTGLPSRFEFGRPDGGGRPIMVVRGFHDWKQVGPIRVPHTIQERSVAGNVELSLQEANIDPIPASTFALTPCAKKAFAAPVEVLSPPDLNELPTVGDYHSKLIAAIGPTLVQADGTEVSSSILADQPDVLLYFTAKWCGPCRRFTPKLVKFYEQVAGRRDFMVVLVSSDRAADQMYKYMKDYKIDFPAIPFDRIEKSGIKKKWGARGIPNLVWLDGEDEVVRGSYEKGRYVGPAQVLGAFGRHLGIE
ncbi:MAG: redoxin family protein [Planctomycetes bacterium]|jgi:thiol-disulfide isomerase/thioredoxin|nr:redoxin family protein [Planctomycetota bacterium]MCP4839320.1 redoxin family protein [Planctomycetota bacterium]